MSETALLDVAIVFGLVYLLNVIPAFAPPTWMALSFIGFNRPDVSVPLLALLGASAATSGRVTLAKLAREIVRRRFFDERKRRNVDAIKEALEGHRTLTVGAFLLYAFTPFPSNFLFIAYGLTLLPLRRVAVPFFVGRFLSYSFWIFGAATAAKHVATRPEEPESWLGVWFLTTQCLVLALLYAFTRVDWNALLHRRKFRWLGRDDGEPPGPR
jgi:membrane protein YqaA with SNARE-associated domain